MHSIAKPRAEKKHFGKCTHIENQDEEASEQQEISDPSTPLHPVPNLSRGHDLSPHQYDPTPK
ncbi:hypothetical protein LOAG_01223 [Loa loa]|uniref:Zinc finger protein n=1 Tax=Loa loa TaxID=7209 RepID=A0A1I7VQR4_LOALO|nr:hypothetical protein LOAG_01223 [Loa loa]EFO27255.2 hypothetical protein LOAG_01223 [Loa loa]